MFTIFLFLLILNKNASLLISSKLKLENFFRTQMASIHKICYFPLQIFTGELSIAFLICCSSIWQHRSKKGNSVFLIDTDYCEEATWTVILLYLNDIIPYEILFKPSFHFIYSKIFHICIQLDYFPSSLGIPGIFDLAILSIPMIYFFLFR